VLCAAANTDVILEWGLVMARVTHARSDDLPILRDIFQNIQTFLRFPEIVQIPLIVDASAIIEDIRWLSCIASNTEARTNLLEAIESQTILAYAPTYIDEELAKNIPIVAAEEGVSVELLETQWGRFRQSLRLIDCGGPDERFLDQKDAPYVKLQREIDAPVSSRDPHFNQMGVPLISVKIIRAAKDYSREAAVEYSIKIAGVGSLMVSTAIVRGAWELLRSLGVEVRRLPSWLWLVVLGAVCAAVTSERVQEWLTQKAKLWGPDVRHAMMTLIEELAPLIEQHYESQRRANELRSVLVEKVDV